MQRFCLFSAGEENSRVQAHIDDHEFSARILTDEAEYNIEVKYKPRESQGCAKHVLMSPAVILLLPSLCSASVEVHVGAP